MSYFIKALGLALLLSSPLYPALYYGLTIERPAELGCMTDTECEAEHGTGWFTDELD